VGRTREAAFAGARDAHDEWCKFLSPYGRFRSYRLPDGSPVPFAFRPELEDSVDQGVMMIGSVDDVVDHLGRWQELLGLQHVVLFFDMPGLTRHQLDDQLHLFAEEVAPRAGIRLGA
jgi:alkanesulfonate monooxygenase SsuD/methylene tetrahydromethanopterin reductase-like flavin-dependent oxidoreductase (luciferase family)